MDPSPSLVCRRFCRCRFDVDVRRQLFSIVFDVDVCYKFVVINFWSDVDSDSLLNYDSTLSDEYFYFLFF
jgi:hypothetical protein